MKCIKNSDKSDKADKESQKKESTTKIFKSYNNFKEDININLDNKDNNKVSILIDKKRNLIKR